MFEDIEILRCGDVELCDAGVDGGAGDAEDCADDGVVVYVADHDSHDDGDALPSLNMWVLMSIHTLVLLVLMMLLRCWLLSLWLISTYRV